MLFNSDNERYIVVNGYKAFVDHIHAQTLRVNGIALFKGGVTANQLVHYGSCEVKGQCHISELNSSGRSSFGTLHGRNIKATGSLQANSVAVSETFRLRGKLSITCHLTAREVYILQQGGGQVSDIEARDNLDIRNDASALSNWLTLQTSKGRYNRVRGRNLGLNDVNTELVTGVNVTIGSNCEIRKILYSGSLSIHPSAKVTSVLKVKNEIDLWSAGR